jgi:hypothetical protein
MMGASCWRWRLSFVTLVIRNHKFSNLSVSELPEVKTDWETLSSINTRVWTEGFALARQALYCLIYSFSLLFFFLIFKETGPCCDADPGVKRSSSVSRVAETAGMYTVSGCTFVFMGSKKVWFVMLVMLNSGVSFI